MHILRDRLIDLQTPSETILFSCSSSAFAGWRFAQWSLGFSDTHPKKYTLHDDRE